MGDQSVKHVINVLVYIIMYKCVYWPPPYYTDIFY